MDYTTVKIPKELATEIDDMLASGFGYTSRVEFVKEAVRQLLIALKSKEA